MTTKFNMTRLKEYMGDTILYLDSLYDEDVDVILQKDLIVARTKLMYVFDLFFFFNENIADYIEMLEEKLHGKLSD